MCSLLISPFSRNFIKWKRPTKVSFQLIITSVLYSYGTWFLDGRTSILVFCRLNYIQLVMRAMPIKYVKGVMVVLQLQNVKIDYQTSFQRVLC